MTHITEELTAALQAWAGRVLAKDVDGLMKLYLPNAVLKPTLSPVIRTTPEGIRDYFEGTPSHPGFALKGWEKVEFSEPAAVLIAEDSAMAVIMIKCGFTKDHQTTIADKTFVYQKQAGKWMIQNHHSSLEYNGAH